uniref:Putative secreted protein n=1 Tax=Anopheles darlingi TaxID=43151 RepID=A0A2M4DKZ2_ANODA
MRTIRPATSTTTTAIIIKPPAAVAVAVVVVVAVVHASESSPSIPISVIPATSRMIPAMIPNPSERRTRAKNRTTARSRSGGAIK